MMPSAVMPSSGEFSVVWLICGAVASGVISFASVRARLLTSDGGLAQFVLGWLLIGLGGLPWTFPIIAFFLPSSLLSHWSASRRPSVHASFSKGVVRDGWQVLANGGLAGVLVVISFVDSRAVWFAAYAGVCAAAAADTWGTEIGVFSRREPRLVPSLRPVPPGTSGAVSLTGTLGSLAGAGLVSVVAALSFPGDGDPSLLIAGIVGGIVGAVTDSLAGAGVQGRFQCSVCGADTERVIHCAGKTILRNGYRWISNDVVNLLCAGSGALAAGLVFQWLSS